MLLGAKILPTCRMGRCFQRDSRCDAAAPAGGGTARRDNTHRREQVRPPSSCTNHLSWANQDTMGRGTTSGVGEEAPGTTVKCTFG